MAMAKKHFEMFANCIERNTFGAEHALRDTCAVATNRAIRAVAVDFADMAQADNARFDRVRFMRAYGFEV